MVLTALALALWLVSLRLADASIVDLAWGPFFAVAAWIYLVLGPGGTGWRWAFLAAVTLWAIRLSLHLLWRARGRGEDRRYRAMRESAGESFRLRSLFTVFLLQALLAAALTAPMLAVLFRPLRFPRLFLLGAAGWLVGFVWEAVADAQLLRFASDPTNRGRVLRRGLWSLCRHPNYFGEAVLWWGYGAMAAATGAWWALAAPAVMTWLLLRVSGVALLERTVAERRPAYRAYVATTPAFLPRWPSGRLGSRVT